MKGQTTGSAEAQGLSVSSKSLEEKIVAAENMAEQYLSTLRTTLPQTVDKEDTIVVTVPTEIVKNGLVEQARYIVVFGFTGRIPNCYEVTQWLQSPTMLGGKDKVDSVNYLAKGFYSVRFKEEDDTSQILRKGALYYNRAGVCVISWEPLFDSAESLQGIHPVWVEFVGLPCWLWEA